MAPPSDISQLVPVGIALVIVNVTAWLYYFLTRGGAATKEEAPPAAAARLDPADEALALIKRRRSIFPKDYTGAAPDRALVECMLDAANWAPTHGKTEPWRFTVLSGDALEKWNAVVAAAMAEKLGVGTEAHDKHLAKVAKKAGDKANVAYLIAVGMKRQALPDKVMPEWEELCAVACAVQNLHLMATASGVAGYWSSGGPLDAPPVLGFLGLDGAAGDKCLGLFHVGLATDAKVAAYRAKRGPIADKVRWLS